MKHKIITGILIFIFLLLILSFKKDKTMDKYEFYKMMLNQGKINRVLKIKFDGEEKTTQYSNLKCIHFEETVFFGDPVIKSAYYSPYFTEDNFYLLYNGYKVKLTYRDIRTYLAPGFSKTFKKDDINKDIPYSVKKALESTNRVLFCQYVLTKNKIYYAKIHTETYTVMNKGEPEEKHNHVIWISDKNFKINNKPQEVLTPLYQDWSY